ncbi:MAG: hypothetical protein MI861_04810, partial [Pirellulales bacterium]|nr:hypothetical protein [Pirellulales bacterium]
IASHGFSHMLVSEGCSAASFGSELRASKVVASERGIDLRSFVYPKNQVGHVELLRQHGFVAYRGPRGHAPVAQRAGGGVRRQADRVLLGAGSAVYPVNEHGLWNFPATALFPTDGQRGRVMLQDWQLRRRMDQAVEHRGLFHLWFHPHNLRSDPVRSLRRLDRLCARAARLRDAGELETHTFGSLADRLTATPLPN